MFEEEKKKIMFEEEKKIMFEEERKEWNAFFNYYKEKFGEDVGLKAAVYEDDQYEIDLAVGENSEKILGFRIINYVENTGEESDNKKENEDEEETEKGEEGEEEEIFDVFAYDLVRDFGKISGKPMIKFSLDDENNEINKNDQLSVTIYSENGEINSDITCAIIIKTSEPNKRILFGNDPEFE
ncbi:MAG: hypothetical protein ACTSWY_14090 [Promethearchaeota archaeon]